MTEEEKKDMDEYIKREDALDAVLFALVGTGHQSSAIYAIRDVPTADVAPKSEVAGEIFEEIDELIFQHGRGDLADKYFYLAMDELKKKYTEEKE